MSLAQLIYFFTIYSFIGWLIESVYVSYQSKKLISRGFLFGPFCPIYGFGLLAILFFVSPFSQKNIFIFFLGATLITSLIEYLTGYFCEKILHVTWWDYSQEKFNLGGKICLRNSLYWGLLSLVCITFIHPSIIHLTQKIILISPILLPSLLVVYFLADLTLATISLYGFRKILDQFNELRNEAIDAIQLEELKEDIIEKQNTIIRYFTHKYRRLLRAFPNIKSSKYYILDDIKLKIDELKAKKIFD